VSRDAASPDALDALAMQRLGYGSPTVVVRGVRIESGAASPVEEVLAEETPVSIAYNLASHTVMMATPADLEEFAVGFSLTEGIVRDAAEIGGVQVVRHGRGIELQIDVPVEVGLAAASRSRRLSGRTGCGLCGTDDIDRVLREVPVVSGGVGGAGSGGVGSAGVAPGAILRAMRALGERQPLNAETGAVHAAGWARLDGELAYVREDVGRHNALDKLVGALVRAGERAVEGFVVMTSRGSFELVQKVAVLGAPLLATVSAPTGLAVRVAERAGVCLVGFARGERLTVYAHPERVAGSA
jgi:formate dehydrogenase accessory protein FdhD